MDKRIGKQEKQRLVERYLCGETVEKLSKEAGVSSSSVYGWVKSYRSGIQTNPINLKEHKTLKRMLERQKLIVYILQNAPCKVNDPLRQRLEAIRFMSGKYNVNTLCQAFGVPKGTYYNYLLRSKGENSQATKRRAELKPVIEEIYNNSNQNFVLVRLQQFYATEVIKFPKDLLPILCIQTVGLVCGQMPKRFIN